MLPVTCCDQLSLNRQEDDNKIRLESVRSLAIYSLFIKRRYPRDKVAEGKEENKPKD